MTAPLESAAAPVPAEARIVLLDVLRGFALFGVFLVNVGYSSGFAFETEHDAADTVALAVLRGLFETKFVTLFSLLFGMGLVLQLGRAAQKGVPMTAVYLRRLALLCAMGIVHGYLLFSGDILFLYSIAGGVLFLFHRAPPLALTLLATIPLAIGLVLGVVFGAEDSGGGAVLVERILGEMERQAAQEGPLALTFSMRVFGFWLLQILFSFLSFNWRVLAMFFLGAAALKGGLLRAEHRRLHGVLALLLVALGVSLESLAFLTDWNQDWSAPRTILAHEVGSIVLGFGYAFSVAWCVHGGLFPWLTRKLACVGRMALTNYIAQSVLMNLVFYWYGLGLWGRLPLWQAMALVGVLFSLQIAFSVWWMSRLRMGPLEWAWRALTYGKRPAWR